MIDDPARARALARTIFADLSLYGELDGPQRDARIAEARALFASRVAPSLASVFDEVLADPDGTGPASATAVVEERGGLSRYGALAAFALIALVFVLGALGYLFLSRPLSAPS